MRVPLKNQDLNCIKRSDVMAIKELIAGRRAEETSAGDSDILFPLGPAHRNIPHPHGSSHSLPSAGCWEDSAQ